MVAETNGTRETLPDPEGGEYELIRPIGSGGIASVYEVHHTSKGWRRAAKILRSRMDDLARQSFMNEIQHAMTVSHTNVIKYYSFHDGSKYGGVQPYIIMELADDKTLSDLLHARGGNKFFTNDELSNKFGQLLDGMEAINRVLIHRDIKPSNILIANGVLKISDLGLARLVAEDTRTITFKGRGTDEYIAPEGWSRDEKNTIQMDVYSMGIVFYEMACLKHPLAPETEDRQGWEDAHKYGLPKDPRLVNTGLSATLSLVIMKMIDKNPEKRGCWARLRQMLEQNTFAVELTNKPVDVALGERLDRDFDEAKQSRARHTAEQHKRLVKHRFRADIFGPLEHFIQEYNSRYRGTKSSIILANNGYSFAVVTSSGKVIRCGIHPTPTVPDGEVQTESIPNAIGSVKVEKYGDIFFEDGTPVEYLPNSHPPKYKENVIMAWGYVKEGIAQDPRVSHCGFNLLLAAKEGVPYGDWHIITHDPLLGQHASLVLDANTIWSWLRGAEMTYAIHVNAFDVAQVQSFVIHRI